MIPVNYLAILVAAVVNMALGAVWFGPLFGKAWMRASGMTEQEIADCKTNKGSGMGQGKSMTQAYIIMFVGSLVMGYVLAASLVFADSYLHASGVMAGLQGGFWNWLGFVAPVTIGVVLWDKKSWKYWAITYLHTLVGLLIMGVILALWM